MFPDGAGKGIAVETPEDEDAEDAKLDSEGVKSVKGPGPVDSGEDAEEEDEEEEEEEEESDIEDDVPSDPPARRRGKETKASKTENRRAKPRR